MGLDHAGCREFPAAPGTGQGHFTGFGIPVGILIIVCAFILTGVYVFRANGRFDALTNALQEDLT